MGKGIHFYKNIMNRKGNGGVKEGAADPFIYKHNGFYYLLCTKERGLVLQKSFDLIHWEYVHEDGIVAEDEYLKYAFAPELFYDNGYFYIVSSPSGNGHRIYRSTSLEGPYEPWHENIQELIDGSFFKDSDGKKYFLRASESGITIKRFKENKEKTDFDLFDEYYNFNDSSIGNWTEGPYLLKRYGIYYLTYTGTHFLSNAYRVDYSSGKRLCRDGLKFQDTLLISTTDQFYGLGHSMTFLGPDLDSYYLAYHNMMPNKERYLNITRLMFDAYGQMLCNGISVERNIRWDRPYFEERIQTSHYLSLEKMPNRRFSCEYNFLGEEVQLILSYENEKHYQYLQMFEDRIDMIKKDHDKEEVVFSQKLQKTYRLDVFHSIRLQYAKERLTIYLDDMEVALKAKAKVKEGRIGFFNNQLKESYLAYSFHAYGSSDQEAMKKENFFLADTLKKKKGYETTLLVDISQDYDVFLSSEKEQTLQLQIDQQKFSIHLHKGKNYISTIFLKKGKHRITFFNIKPTKEIFTIRKHDYPVARLQHDRFLKQANIFYRYLPMENGFYFENDRNAILTKEKYLFYELEVQITLVGNPTKTDRFIGLMSDVSHYGKTNEFENAYSFMGWMFVLNHNEFQIIDANYDHSKAVWKKKKPHEETFILKIRKDEKKLLFYLNQQLVYETEDIFRHLPGQLGMMNNHASGIFRNYHFINLEIKEGAR